MSFLDSRAGTCPAVAVATLALLLSFGASATAESTTVEGTGDIKRMYVKNGQDAVTVKLHGLGPPCQGAQYFEVHVLWGEKATYKADAGCYPQSKWLTGLYYMPDRDVGSKEVECSGFRIVYSSEKKSYRVFIPRSCIGRAPDRVRVRAEGNNYTAAVNGKAGPTRRLRRG